MSDLHQAIRAEIDAYQPEHAPPFEDLGVRRRSRDRGVRAAGGTAAVLAFAAAAAVVVGGGQDRLMPADGTDAATAPPPQKAAPPYRLRYQITYDRTGDQDAAEREVSSCLALPGTTDITVQLPVTPIVSVAVTGLSEAEAFEACIRRIEGVTLATTEEGPRRERAPGRPDPNDPASREAFLPVSAQGTARGDARAEGRLEGDPRTGCLWLSGPGGTRLRIVVMHDTAVADFSRAPFVIRDSDRVLATEGDVLVLGGGTAPVDDPRPFGSCPVDGPPFIGAL